MQPPPERGAHLAPGTDQEQKALLRHLLRIGVVAQDAPTRAEDLIGEVFLDVWRQADRFEGRSSVSTWILGMARFKALSSLRKTTEAELDEDKAAAIADEADNPETVSQKLDKAKAIRRCIDQLSPEHREIVDLVYYQEKSISEVAEIVRIPENTVKTRMFYARKRLQELMQSAGVDRGWP